MKVSIIEMCLFLPGRAERVRVTYARETLHPPRTYRVYKRVFAGETIEIATGNDLRNPVLHRYSIQSSVNNRETG